MKTAFRTLKYLAAGVLFSSQFLVGEAAAAVASNSFVQFSTTNYFVAENVSAGHAVIFVTRTGPLTNTATVTYSTSPGTATPGADYTNVSGILSFPPGETSQSFDVPITDDSTPETNETVQLFLTNSVNASFGTPSMAILTIVNNETNPPNGTVQFSARNYVAAENVAGGQASISVVRSGNTSGTLTVNYATSDGIATAGLDYSSAVGTLTFASGETSRSFAVPLLDDGLVEGTETVQLTLYNSIGGGLGEPSQATLCLLDDEVPPWVQLRIHWQGSNAVISWPTRYQNYVLEEAAALASPITWSPVAALPMPMGDEQSLLLSSSATNRFYRLRQKAPPPPPSACGAPLEFDHEFAGEALVSAGSEALLFLRHGDQHIRFIATDSNGDTDTHTVQASSFQCYRGATPVDCCEPGVDRIVFSYFDGSTFVNGTVLTGSNSCAVVDVSRGNTSVQYLLTPCASNPIISGGRKKYQGKFAAKVFRRGEDTPQIALAAGQFGQNPKPIVDIFKRGNANRVQRITKFNLHRGFYVATWDWENERNWEIPGDIPVGIYDVTAKSEVNNRETVLGKCVFYVIFQKPKDLPAADEKAYLYDEGKDLRDERSLDYNGYQGLLAVRDAMGKVQMEMVGGKNQPKRRHKNWFESGYTLDPFNEHQFDLVINALDGQTSEATAAEGLMEAVANVIFYSTPHAAKLASRMFAGVTVKQFVAAYNGTEAQLILGQCLDYANGLAAFYRSIGIPARVATDIQNGGFHFHEWTEAFIQEPPAGADQWYSYDAMDYTTEPHNPMKDLAAAAQGSAERTKAGYGDKAYEVPVGNPTWIKELGAQAGYMEIDFTVSKAKRVRNVNDALFEKCENNKYDNASCNLPDPPVADASANLSLLIANDVYRVGEEVVMDVSIINPDNVPMSTSYKFTLSRFADGDDGRDAYGDPVLNVAGSGVWGELLYQDQAALLVPPNSQVQRQYRFDVSDTDFPRDRYLAEASISSPTLEDVVVAQFTVLPAYDVTINTPATVGPLDTVPVEVVVRNQVAFPIGNIAIELNIPLSYSSSGSLNVIIPTLSSGQMQSVLFNIRPVQRDFVSDIALALRVSSDNGGTFSEMVRQDIDIPPTLFVPSTVIAHTNGANSFPVSFRVLNVGENDTPNVTVRLRLPDDIPPGSVMVQNDTFLLSTLAAGTQATLSTTVTTTLSSTFHLEILAEDTSGRTASGLLTVRQP